MHSHASSRRFRGAVWAATASVAALAACDRDTVAPTQLTTKPTVTVEASSVTASVGDQIAVALGMHSPWSVGGLQGTLRYNPARLRYRGQATQSGALLVVNDKREDEGVLRIGAIDSHGLGDRVGTLVFDVINDNATQGLSFGVEVLTSMKNERATMFPADPRVQLARDLVVARDAKRMGIHELALSINAKDADLSPRFTPGQIVPGLVYGNADLSPDIPGPPHIPQITINDALITLLASVGSQELIVGTDAPDAGNSSPGKDMVLAANVFPAAAGGLPAGWVSANDPGVIDVSDALEIVLASVGVAQPTAGHEMAGREATAPGCAAPGQVGGRVTVGGNISTSTTWLRGCVYQLHGNTTVTGGATLTIERGVRIEGERGTGPGVGGSDFVVARDGKLMAVGTELEPIVFTCVGEPKSKGCWGGFIVNGNARLNEGTATSPSVTGRSTAAIFTNTADRPGAGPPCLEKTGEGATGLYGGCNDDDNSGVIRYVRVEYGGFRFTPENELNNIAFQGVGRGTTIDHIQAHAGLDDGVEFFGGVPDVKYLVLTANSDDSFDWVESFSGRAQFVIIQHDPLDSDKGFEADNTNTSFDAQPRARPQIYNVTLVGKPDPNSTLGTPNNNSVGAMHIRRGTRPTIKNAIVQNFAWALNIDDDPTCVSNAEGTFTITNSIYAGNARLDAPAPGDPTDPAGCGAAPTEDTFLHNATLNPGNTFVATSPLLSPLNVMLPDFRPAFGTANAGVAPPNDGFFNDPIITGTTQRYQGAVEPANASKSNRPWYAGWTRGWQSSTTP